MAVLRTHPALPSFVHLAIKAAKKFDLIGLRAKANYRICGLLIF
jgi:hypothetical protein